MSSMRFSVYQKMTFNTTVTASMITASTAGRAIQAECSSAAMLGVSE